MDRREATFPAALVSVADQVEARILRLLEAEIARWAAVEPALLRDPVALRQAAWRLARTELVRRHRYHALQAATAALRLAVESDAVDLYWGLEAPQAFAPDATRAGRDVPSASTAFW